MASEHLFALEGFHYEVNRAEQEDGVGRCGLGPIFQGQAGRDLAALLPALTIQARSLEPLKMGDDGARVLGVTWAAG